MADDLSPGKRACLRRWQQIETAARQVVLAWDQLDGEKASIECLRRCLDGSQARQILCGVGLGGNDMEDERRTNFDRYVEELERNPEFKALLDEERERLRRELDDEDPFAGVAVKP